MIWSDLHGDVESQADPKRPGRPVKSCWEVTEMPKVAKFLVG